MIFSLICLFLVKFFIPPTVSTLPNNKQNIQSDDITSLPDRFPLIVGKIEGMVKRLRCPKGWKRLGGSCYYFSNSTSTSTHVNHTCNHLHSNLSNLLQIRNAVELFYAAHVLSRNNLTSLMIDIDPSLLKGRKISEMLMNDQGRWERMKRQFSAVRDKYQILAQSIVNRLNSAGIRISRRSRKRQELFDENKLNDTIINSTSIVDNDEYEYDDLDSSDESDEFEQINSTRGICDEIHWNALIDNHHNSTTYILTKYNMSDKIVCSLSDVQLQTKYHHVCEYVLDYCFANIMCGKHGRCENTLAGFKCSCSFLYGGLFCETFTQEGIEIIVSCAGMVIALVFIYELKSFIINSFKSIRKKCRKMQKPKNENVEENNEQTQLLTTLISSEQVGNEITSQSQAIVQNHKEIAKKFRVPSSSSRRTKPDYIRITFVGILSLFILILLYSTTVFRYMKLFNIDARGCGKPEKFHNSTYYLVKKCARQYNYQTTNLIVAPVALSLIIYFSFLIKRKARCLETCDARPGLLPPFAVFERIHRFSTATVFGILTYEVSKIFEGLLFGLGHEMNGGVFREISIRIATIFLVGCQYYPVLASLHLQNVVARFLTCLYIIWNIIYTIAREGSCMGSLPVVGELLILEEAKLRRELGTWFIVYGVIKNIPHFVCLSYISAELCVRFAYDSIYVSTKKKNRYIQPVSNEQMYIFAFAEPHVTKLLRPNRGKAQTITQQNANIANPIDNGAEEQNQTNQSCFSKLLKSIYVWDADFRFTTMIICTYTVATVFLFYLACTFVFLYLSRTTGHLAFLRFYIELSANTELETIPFKIEIIVSAVLTAIIYGIQLLSGMKQFKIDKTKSYKERKEKKSENKDFDPIEIASNSVHYSGHLIGFMGWGFIICFHLILFIFILIRIMILQIVHIVIILHVVVPIVVIYLLKKIFMLTIGKYLLVSRQNKGEKNDQYKFNNPKVYAICVYFILFADCFLGIASCIIHLIISTLASVLYMARPDYSSLGRPLRKYDPGYTIYDSYLRMELNYTNAIMLSFCSSCYSGIQKHPRVYYDEECCTTATDADRSEEPRENRSQQNGTNPSKRNNADDVSRQSINHNIHESPSKRIPKTSSRLQKNDSSSLMIHENNPKRVKYNQTNDNVVTSIPKIMPTPKPQSSPLTTDGTNFKQQTSNISDNQVKGDENNGRSITRISFTPEQPPRSSKPSARPTHLKPPSQQDQTDDDDGSMKRKSSSTIKKQPRLKPSVIDTNNSTADEEDDEDDGGVTRKKIIKQKQKVEEKKQRKDDLKKKKQSFVLTDSFDEDGAMLKQKHHIKKTKTKKKSMFAQCFQEEDEDHGALKQKSAATENKKNSGDSDDDGVPKRKKPVKKKTANKSYISHEEEDEDGGRVIKTYDTIKKIIPAKKPILDDPKAKDQSSADNNGNTIEDRTTPALSVNTPSTKLEKTADKNLDHAIPTEEENVAQTTANSSPQNSRRAFLNKIYSIRTTSYCEAQQRSPPAVLQQPINSSTLYDQTSTNDQESHYSEIPNEASPLNINNPVGSVMNAIRFLSSYSNEQQTLTEDDHTEPRDEKQRLRRRKIARTRWYLAYTLIHNRSLIQERRKEPAKVRLSQSAQSQRQSETIPNGVESETLKTRKTKVKKTKSSKVQPSTTRRVSPIPNIDDHSQRLTERNIPVLSDVHTNRATTFYSVSTHQTSTTEVLQHENANSSRRYTQRTFDRRIQEWQLCE